MGYIDLPRWYVSSQVQPTDGRKDHTHNDLQPNHPYVRVVCSSSSIASPGLSGLGDSRGHGQPAEPQREAPRKRRNDKVITCHLL